MANSIRNETDGSFLSTQSFLLPRFRFTELGCMVAADCCRKEQDSPRVWALTSEPCRRGRMVDRGTVCHGLR